MAYKSLYEKNFTGRYEAMVEIDTYLTDMGWTQYDDQYAGAGDDGGAELYVSAGD